MKQLCPGWLCGAAALLQFVVPSSVDAGSVARTWNEQNLKAIRLDIPHPPAHARNLYHGSVAMWDAWAAYDAVAVGYVHNEDVLAPDIDNDGVDAADIAAAREEAISYAAYRVLRARYANSANSITTAIDLVSQFLTLGFDDQNVTVTGDSPAAVGNRVAAAVLAFGATDYSNEQNGYADPTYLPVNDPLPLLDPSLMLFTVSDPNRWQPLSFGEWAFTQNGLQTDLIQVYQGAHWGRVRPFAMSREYPSDVYYDPGMPPQLGGAEDEAFKDNINEVLRFSSWLDPDDGVVIELSPAVHGNHSLGQNDGIGHGLNPVSGQAYSSNTVKRADYGRVLAEFWADGPSSETPPGHWNVLANEVTDNPLIELRVGGVGELVDELEWDVKRYFAMNGAMHDAATAAWTCKRVYDYVRPITMVRYMGANGQSSDPDNIVSPIDPEGLKLESGLVEVITTESSAMGKRHEHLSAEVGSIAVYCWAGEPEDAETQYTGVEWILARDWLPYQRDTFVTPAFAAYVSGHSCFSRAGAEVLTLMTGSPYFPGGLGEHTVSAGDLEFELGPSEDVTLQWASYYDASDEAGISRLYGGIHVAPDDGPGRVIGAAVGIAAFELAEKYWDGSILLERVGVEIAYPVDDEPLSIDWHQNRGLFYKVQSSTDLANWSDETEFVRAEEDKGNFTSPVPVDDVYFYRVLRNATGG